MPRAHEFLDQPTDRAGRTGVRDTLSGQEYFKHLFPLGDPLVGLVVRKFSALSLRVSLHALQLTLK
eukprot:6799573-Pyramimonas_sp.AAC.1